MNDGYVMEFINFENRYVYYNCIVNYIYVIMLFFYMFYNNNFFFMLIIFFYC